MHQIMVLSPVPFLFCYGTALLPSQKRLPEQFQKLLYFIIFLSSPSSKDHTRVFLHQLLLSGHAALAKSETTVCHLVALGHLWSREYLKYSVLFGSSFFLLPLHLQAALWLQGAQTALLTVTSLYLFLSRNQAKLFELLHEFIFPFS